ncbi:hypothetical protein GRAN_4397 [Granulicella sibirica]|uniref:Uncharacterized protein n=1 Tax=Granulicella sibirica TaxID=2479048 RepID=A0A4Q0SW51_9BACT|nr:hypothetical protein GRAN_4397 [Granulicella sibirica]
MLTGVGTFDLSAGCKTAPTMLLVLGFWFRTACEMLFGLRFGMLKARL